MLASSLRRLPALRSTTKSLGGPTATTRRPFSATCTMSTSSREWLVTIPDKPNALQQRLAVRPKHLEKIQPRVEVGQVVLGGATLSEQPAVDGTPEMTGSVLIIKADTEEEVRALIEGDVYTKEGVWDFEKIQIKAFRSAIRTAM